MSVDLRYTQEEVKDIINVQVLALRLQGIEDSNRANWAEFKEHIRDEDKRYTGIYDSISQLNENITHSKMFINQCKTEVEDKVKSQYITREQLDISLMKVSEDIIKQISSKFENFGNRMDSKLSKHEEELKANQVEIKRITYTVSAFITIAIAIAGIVELLSNFSGLMK